MSQLNHFYIFSSRFDVGKILYQKEYKVSYSLCVYACLLCVYVSTCVHAFMHVHACMHKSVHVCACVRVHVRAHARSGIY